MLYLNIYIYVQKSFVRVNRHNRHKITPSNCCEIYKCSQILYLTWTSNKQSMEWHYFMIDILRSHAVKIRIFITSPRNKSRGDQGQLPNHVIKDPDPFYPSVCDPQHRLSSWFKVVATVVTAFSRNNFQSKRAEGEAKRASTWATITFIKHHKLAPSSSLFLCFSNYG